MSDPDLASIITSINDRLGKLVEATLPGRSRKRLLRLQSTWIERFIENGSPQEDLHWSTPPCPAGIGESGRLYDLTTKKSVWNPSMSSFEERDVPLGKIQIMREGSDDTENLLANRVEVIEKLAEALITTHTHVLAGIESCGHPLQRLAMTADEE